MKERPILFSTPMVQAIRAGWKTQTRRIVKFPKCYQLDTLSDWELRYNGNDCSFWKGPQYTLPSFVCPYGKPGDLLWVRESFNYFYDTDGSGQRTTIYRCGAESVINNVDQVTWKPSIHMPKNAARIWLLLKAVRVEQLHAISRNDIRDEGVRVPISKSKHAVLELGTPNNAISFFPPECFQGDGIQATEHQWLFAHWAELWCKVNGRESWDANPWVWVLDFEVLSTTGKPKLTASIEELA